MREWMRRIWPRPTNGVNESNRLKAAREALAREAERTAQSRVAHDTAVDRMNRIAAEIQEGR